MTLSGFQITCANKNQNGTIVRVGGPDWSLSRQEAIQKIIMKQIVLYISVGDESFYIGVRGEGHDSYLILEPDGPLLSEIEQLRSC